MTAVKKLFIPLITTLLLLTQVTPSYAGDAEITLKARATESATTVQRAAVKPQRTRSNANMQRMLRELKPMTVPVGGNQNQIGTKPPKYEVADCTGSNGQSMACCSWSPGSGGSSCDMFLALCDSHDGWTGTGNSNGATCQGEGTVN
ncbi:hypothetical protein [Oceanicoccus sp. KOV_DT_Chl]|uniref:hypothetical protein n=1 Tax=Oceanicoccus sp. KOV_DT_Chl TaxID=1904639 RepID=UPI000C7DD32C|nr:hypothetical protein [Oceanicoccus sp. KOV_DT_Chl]